MMILFGIIAVLGSVIAIVMAWKAVQALLANRYEMATANGVCSFAFTMLAAILVATKFT